MSAKVHHLRTIEGGGGGPPGSLAEIVGKIMEHARAGDVTDLSCVMVREDGSVVTVTWGSQDGRGSLFTLIGALEAAKASLIAEVES